MKPSDNLIAAWHAYLGTMKRGKGFLTKAEMCFRHAQHDVELYNRALVSHKTGRNLEQQADVVFRKALKKEWCKRFRIEWKDYQTCVVWVHHRHHKEEYPMAFNKSIRRRPV